MITKHSTAKLIAVATATVCMASVAEAATLKNLDKKAHKIVVVEGDARQELMIDSQQELAGLCQSSCSLFVGTDPEPYDVAAKDKMEINNGEVYYQEEQGKAPAQ